MTGAWGFALLGCALACWWRLELSRRGRLVARACHELRGPLTAAGLALHAAARDGRAPLGAVELELRRAALALEDLQAARAGRRGAHAAETVDIARLLAVQGDTWRAVARACRRDLRVSGPPCAVVVRGDRVRLAQAIANLVANALEHGSGVVVLSARPSAGRVRLEVADEGPGLPAPVDRLLARAGGAGARRGHGLAVAADVAARHGGRLVASAGEGGARVALELPAIFAVPATGSVEAATA